MAILDILGAFSASGLLGGITGIIGTELKSRRELKIMKLNNEMERAKWPENQKQRDHEINLHQINMNAKAEEFEHMILMSETDASGKGLEMSIKADMDNLSAWPWVGAVRSLTRPFLALLLLILTAVIFHFLPVDGRMKIASAVVYMTVTAVLFYFGDRPSSAMRSMLLSTGQSNER